MVKGGQVKVEQLFKNSKIMSGKVIDAAFHRAYDLTGCTEGIFVVDQQKGQIVVPEVSGKPKGAGHLHKLVDALKEQLLSFF